MTLAATLLPFAQAELAARVLRWPDEVAAGRMPAAEAEADIAAWRGIAELLERGGTDRADEWQPLLGAIDRALARRAAAARQAVDRHTALLGIEALAARSAAAVGEAPTTRRQAAA